MTGDAGTGRLDWERRRPRPDVRGFCVAAGGKRLARVSRCIDDTGRVAGVLPQPPDEPPNPTGYAPPLDSTIETSTPYGGDQAGGSRQAWPPFGDPNHSTEIPDSVCYPRTWARSGLAQSSMSHGGMGGPMKKKPDAHRPRKSSSEERPPTTRRIINIRKVEEVTDIGTISDAEERLLRASIPVSAGLLRRFPDGPGRVRMEGDGGHQTKQLAPRRSCRLEVALRESGPLPPYQRLAPTAAELRERSPLSRRTVTVNSRAPSAERGGSEKTCIVRGVHTRTFAPLGLLLFRNWSEPTRVQFRSLLGAH